MKRVTANIFTLAIIILVFVFAGLLWIIEQQTLVSEQRNNKETKTVISVPGDERNWRCLEADEYAYYPLREGTLDWMKIPELPLRIIVQDRSKDKTINNFSISQIRDNYHPVEKYNCGIYLIKQFNYNPNKIIQDSGYTEELWKYDYNGIGKKILILAEKKKTEFVSYYNTDFRVDPKERYVVLIKGILEDRDYSLVIKDLNTKEDVFTLKHKELFEKNNNFIGTFNMKEWTRDGRYFWFSLSAGANTHGFVHIDTDTWEYEMYDVPEGLMNGEKLNTEKGLITYHTGLVWSGIHEIQEEIKAERRAQGVGTSFYIYNLITGKKALVQETMEPLWWSEPHWVSDTEVEYTTPKGEKMIYKIE